MSESINLPEIAQEGDKERITRAYVRFGELIQRGREPAEAYILTVLRAINESRAAVIKETRAKALEEAARECDETAADQMEQARGGDNSGASDHRADIAEALAADIRFLIGKEQG